LVCNDMLHNQHAGKSGPRFCFGIIGLASHKRLPPDRGQRELA
jgi:hypothetical protein